MANDENPDISERTKFFLTSLKKEEREKIAPYLPNFESSCILSTFEEAILIIPFDPEEGMIKGLQGIHGYIRQTIIAKLGERLLVDAVYKNDKSSKESASVLIRRITADPTEEGNGGFPAVPQINVNFVKATA